MNRQRMNTTVFAWSAPVLSLFLLMGAAPAANAAPDRSRASAAENLPACRYKVKQGDTARSIAALFGISYATLRSLNPGVNLDHLTAGQWLRVPDRFC
ncbi:LysM peptidoglycan-binding domain-containing protein [Actinomadura graeca]|uniref:LysM peptidoglycan-binding domain-containing protein n=1 Tax=Actinomadura graeca TaxID=2750812 RepID=A0ABX8QQG9_9ACTN|nr:LysM domain-containing protein [Actinomadura graeca]QXJ20666.1 LysM peptidoglycan-binding domain-containing protein [Actinomadura graeca]